MDETGRFPDQIPQTIGRYQVQEGIGFGAMGAVYKAFDPLIKRTLAIKTLRLDIPRNSPQYKSFIDRFYHEARISGTLSHPNIVTLFDIGEEGGVPYLAMEFVEGETLASILEKGTRFKPERVISLVSQIASAVDYAHSKGVIHRDIKPSNLILYDADRVKVTDFGIAKLADAEMTQSGTLLGTPAYMSPEQAMGEKLDGRSDIFSLGVCAFEMLSGEQPFAGPNVTAILYKLVHVEPVEPANLEMNGLVPQKWREVFSKALAKKPDDRYQTATEFVQDLEYCLGAWFGSAMLDTLVDEDGSSAVRAAAQAALMAAGPPPAPAAQASAAPPPAPPGDEVTAALPRPDSLEAVPAPTAASPAALFPLVDDDDVPATVLIGAAGPLPSDTDTRPVRPAPEPDVEGTVRIKGAGRTAPPALRPPAAPTGSTVVIPEPPPPPFTVRVPTPGPPPVARSGPRAAPAPRPDPADTPPTVRMSAAAMEGPASAPPEPRVRRRAAPTPVVAAAAAASAPSPPTGPTAVQAAPAIAGGRAGRTLALAGSALLALLVATAAAGLMLLRRAGNTETSAAAPPTAAPTAPPPTQALAPTPEATPGVPEISGSLRVESQPPGAAITVDGQLRGATPLDLSELSLGAHEVKAELKGFAPTVQKVILTAEAPQSEVKLTLTRGAPSTGIAEVHSTPSGALVRIDGVTVGETPLRQHRVKAGSHTVEVLKDGYQPWSGNLDVQGTRAAHVEAQLRPVVRTPPAAEAVDTSRVYLPNEVDTPPRRLVGGSAPYPDRAPRLRPRQDVSVAGTFVVTEAGEITDLKLTDSAGALVDEAVMSAVRNWKYAPGVKRGVKVKVRVPFKQTFRAG